MISFSHTEKNKQMEATTASYYDQTILLNVFSK